MGQALDLVMAVRCLEWLLAWSLGLQTLEFLRIHRSGVVERIWHWPDQKDDVPDRPRWLKALLGHLFQPPVHQAHLWLRLAVLVHMAWNGSQAWHFLFLFLSAVVVLIRWRGAFNGGSDFMTLVVLTGGLLAHGVGLWAHPSLGWQAGLWYICIHAISSYFMSGWVKLKHAPWRSGQALTVFLGNAIHGPLPARSPFRKPWLARLSAWAFILWECAFPLALAGPVQAQVMCALAGVFHFLVFWHFGLNRFFWAWVTCFPAVIYCSDWKVGI